MAMVDLQDVPRRAVVRLARLGFDDGARAARLLSDPAVGLWARAGDPDLAVLSLWRLVEALDRGDPVDADGRGPNRR